MGWLFGFEYEYCPECHYIDYSWWYKVKQCKSCGRIFCLNCGENSGERCSKCGSDDYRTLGDAAGGCAR